MANTGFIINTQQKKEVLSIAYPTFADFPTMGITGTYYKSLDDSKVYEWDGDSYEEIEPALDVNGEFCSISGLPQATRPIPPSPNPPYRELNNGSCPVDPSNEVFVSQEITSPDPQMGANNMYGAKFTLSDVLENNLSINFTIQYDLNPAGTGTYTSTLVITAGTLEIETTGYPVTNGRPDGSAIVIVNSVSPNPNGSKTILY